MPQYFNIVGIALIGANQHRLGLLGHEASHGLLAVDRKWNDFLGNIFCMYGIGTTVAAYREWHNQHHRLLGTPRDPEHVVKSGWKYRLPMTRSKIIFLFITDCFGFGLFEVLKLQWVLRPKGKDLVGFVLFWSLATAILWSVSALWILGVWVVSLLTFFWAFYRIRAVSEHTGIRGTYRFHAPLWMRYAIFPHNTWLHHEHHDYPGVPWWNLPKLGEARDRTGSLFDQLSQKAPPQ